MPTERLNARNKRVFDSVFGGPTLSQPTPVATPVGGFTTPGQAFGGPLAFSHDRRQAPLSSVRTTLRTVDPPVNEADQLKDQLQWDRSWHTVTHALVPPDVPSTPELIATWDPKLKENLDAKFAEAMLDVLDPRLRLPHASHTEDIVIWHTNQVRHHFLRQVLPVIMTFHDPSPELLLIRVVDFLGIAHRPYLTGLSIILATLETITPGASPGISERLRRDLHAIINHSVFGTIAQAMKVTLRGHIFAILGVPVTPGPENLTRPFENRITEKCRADLLSLVQLMQQVGLAGEKFQIIFAEMMNFAMVKYVTVGCKGIWSAEDTEARKQYQTMVLKGREPTTSQILPRTALHSPASECVSNLCEWIENGYSRLAVEVFHALGDTQQSIDISWRQVEKWKEIGISHIGKLRTDELYDIVVSWPNTTAALDDLRTSVITPHRRLRLTEEFSNSLAEHVLHAGVSTLQILQTYIAMISSFHALDHSKVLLDRVAYPLQTYLCSRDDTVRIIITGLLSDTEDARGNPILPGGDKLVELAILLNNGQGQVGKKANDDELDWHDPDWMPDPIDAGPGYKRSKNSDILGTLISVLGSQDVFIKEFQSIIGEHLLKNEGSFEKEIKVLELLKSRFGEAPLQSCEVMLKDIQDSGRLNSAIRRNQMLDPSDEEINIAHVNSEMQDGGDMVSEGMLKPSLHAKILSRLYWPQLQDGSYLIPDEIGKLQERYQVGFEALKAARKLTWLHSLGQATVELELTDRTIIEEVQTWQAVVIWDFQNEEAGSASTRRTVEELVEHLEMDETLVRNALKFWVNKLVLQEVEKDAFSVLETLNQEDRERSNAQAAASAAAAPDDGMDEAALTTNEGITEEKGQMYWQFIRGMLKNSSSQMPLQQIAMMLKMLIADGFPYSNEELQVFMGTKVTEGELEFAGGKYRLKK